MRALIAKFAMLTVVGLAGINAVSVSPALAQNTPPADAALVAVTAAAAGNTQALATFLQNNPGAAQTVGDLVAGDLTLGGTVATNLAAALVATGNVALISGVMISANISAASQGAIASALSSSGNTSLATSVASSVQSAGGTSAVAALAALSNLGVTPPATPVAAGGAPAVPPPTVIVPSPAILIAGSGS